MTILKSFPHGYYYRRKESPLSSHMIIALKKAFVQQRRKEPFGPVDIKSLCPLIERGLISLTLYTVLGEEATWYVTKKGLRAFYLISRIKSTR